MKKHFRHIIPIMIIITMGLIAYVLVLTKPWLGPDVTVEGFTTFEQARHYLVPPTKIKRIIFSKDSNDALFYFSDKRPLVVAGVSSSTKREIRKMLEQCGEPCKNITIEEQHGFK